ncbi:MAG: tyrosine--tRNA ligase [Candidatus Paceibacterota bacterium]
MSKKDLQNLSNPDINELLSRGIEKIYPNQEFFKKNLEERKITLYFGIDPTGPTLHLGHMISLKKLRDFQLLGHKIILLIGDFTATIGDPSGKENTRKMLTTQEVLDNAKLYKEQASKFISFEGSNKAEIEYNSKWLSKMTFKDIIELSSQMTVDQMLKRDMFEKRMENNEPIYIHEFLYPLMQGYDSVALNVDAEIGGNDQTFNMLVGRDLMKSLNNKEKFVIAVKLLVDPTGKKMGKTEGNMITFKDTNYEMYGKVMSWTDGMIVEGFEICTDVSLDELENIKKELKEGKNPKELKMRLAREIISLFYNDEEVEQAEKNFTETFSDGGLPKDLSEVDVSKDSLLSDILVAQKIVDSKSEFRRLIDQGAVRDAETGEKITDPFYKIEEDRVFKIGARRFIKIKVK